MIAIQIDEWKMAKVVNRNDVQRGKTRHPVTMVGRLGGSNVNSADIILEVSDDGFSAALQQELQVGSWVELNREGHAAVGATVIWRKGCDHGFKIDEGRPITSAPAGDDARTVIWVDFNAWSIVNGPLFQSSRRKYPGFIRLGLAFSLASAAWVLIVAVAFSVAGLVH